MDRLILAATCLLLSVAPLMADETLVYRHATGDQVTLEERRISSTREGPLIETPQEIAWLTEDGATRRWEFREPDTETTVTAERSGEIIAVTGTLQGREVRREVRSDKEWHQLIEHALEDFAVSGRQSTRLWSFRSDSMDLTEFRAERQGTEALDLPGGMVETVHVEVRLTGLFSAFWHADYWFRATDGRFVRYAAERGRNEPLTVIELVAER